jgi:fucose 4-O-acetylase-like acetyltransferase
MEKSRDIEVDVLRSIGILLIILAHIKAPLMPTVIRCFDVPLMVFVSGLCYSGKTLRGGGTKVLRQTNITAHHTDMVISYHPFRN